MGSTWTLFPFGAGSVTDLVNSGRLFCVPCPTAKLCLSSDDKIEILAETDANAIVTYFGLN